MSRRALAWAVWGALAVRLCLRTRAFAVDLFFWDDWDYHAGYFSGASLWELFRWEHTTHRMGLGNLIPLWLLRLTGWDARTEAWACAACAIAAAAVGLVLWRRLFGTAYIDVLVPLCLLTGLHADSAAGTAALAFAPLPSLLVLLFVLGAVARWPAALLVGVDFFALFTGYGLLFAPFSRALLLARRQWAALAASAGTLALFLWGYQLGGGVACFQFPHPRPLEYAGYASLVLERPLGVSGVAGLRAPLVYGTALALAVALGAALVRAARSRLEEPAALAVTLLGGFALIFAALAAVGRVCLGVDAAAAPRYIAYALLGLFAIAIAARAWLKPPLQMAALAALLLAFVTKEALVTLRPIAETQRLVAGKRAWRECYRRSANVAACDAATGFSIHPEPERTHLRDKLEWLRARKRSLFR